jgi:uncharacterized repeat protein (TIGR03917 family)
MNVQTKTILRQVFEVSVPAGSTVGELMTALSALAAPNAKLLEHDSVEGETLLVFELEEYL